MVVVGILMLCALIFFTLGYDHRLSVQTYRLHAETAGETLRFVVIADLHNAVYGRDQSPLVDAVKAQSPDAIFIVGDIADSYSAFDGVRMLLQKLQGAAPIYYVSGNHEYWSRHIDEMKAEIASYGVKILSDSYERLRIKGVPVTIAGVEDEAKTTHQDPRYNQLRSMRRAFAPLAAQEGVKILLSHRPNAAFAEFPFHLVVSGHIHGGHVRLPLIDVGVFGPQRSFFPRYCGGQYAIGSQALVISHGVALKWMITPRLYNPPELSLIELSSTH